LYDLIFILFPGNSAFRIEDIAGNALKGRIFEATNVALHVVPFETATAFAAVLLPSGFLYTKVFVPWRHKM
jgi:hypothetical protein